WEFAHITSLYGSGTNRIFTQQSPFTAATLIDGFSITQGKADNGGGAYLRAGAIIQNCIIIGNEASENGGGVYLLGATMNACLVSNNIYSSKGGGVYADTGSLIKGCIISGNATVKGEVAVGDLLGGGIVYYTNSTARTAYIVSLDSSDEIAWSNAAAWITGYNSGTFTDWTLPTSTQLQQMYIVKALLDNVLNNTGGIALAENSYWTANDEGAKAKIVMFDTGYAGILDKTANNKVRAVREIVY
ncbi:MAG: right-handed parallel beta-helix repeat-containing protein, partial [Paludibacter sp.]|nr:right-handed parallel beta-helix repeat-containing protein [Paludibacter sp.]